MSGGQITTNDPTYDTDTKVFCQSITFRSAEKIDGEAIGYIVTHAANLFRGSLLMNGFDEFVWPPEKVDAQPAEDFRSGVVTLATRADKRKLIVIN